jgi:hypothetical protein
MVFDPSCRVGHSEEKALREYQAFWLQYRTRHYTFHEFRSNQVCYGIKLAKIGHRKTDILAKKSCHLGLIAAKFVSGKGLLTARPKILNLCPDELAFVMS